MLVTVVFNTLRTSPLAAFLTNMYVEEKNSLVLNPSVSRRDLTSQLCSLLLAITLPPLSNSRTIFDSASLARKNKIFFIQGVHIMISIIFVRFFSTLSLVNAVRWGCTVNLLDKVFSKFVPFICQRYSTNMLLIP